MYGEQGRVWEATAANVSLYDRYDCPLPGRIGLTPHQAALLARAQGRPLPTDAFPALRAPSPPHVCLSSEVFPASPLHLTLRGEVDPATVPDPWRPLGIVLTFPGGPEYVTVPLVATAGNPAWRTATTRGREPSDPR